PGTSLVVCDAGGSTIDTTAYRVKDTSPVLELEEVKASACVQAGGVFVDLECEKHLKGILGKITLEEEERDDYVQNGTNDFETFTKRSFGLKGPDGAPPLEHRVNMQCYLSKGYEEVCRVEAGLSGMGNVMRRKTGPDGDYYAVDYTIALQFGGTELRAFLEWEEGGETRTGPASIIPSALGIVQN
ncbi:hypothetical protein FRC09_014938, partial [Ceratobasidium sp. 395]